MLIGFDEFSIRKRKLVEIESLLNFLLFFFVL